MISKSYLVDFPLPSTPKDIEYIYNKPIQSTIPDSKYFNTLNENRNVNIRKEKINLDIMIKRLSSVTLSHKQSTLSPGNPILNLFNNCPSLSGKTAFITALFTPNLIYDINNPQIFEFLVDLFQQDTTMITHFCSNSNNISFILNHCTKLMSRELSFSYDEKDNVLYDFIMILGNLLVFDTQAHRIINTKISVIALVESLKNIHCKIYLIFSYVYNLQPSELVGSGRLITYCLSIITTDISDDIKEDVYDILWKCADIPEYEDMFLDNYNWIICNQQSSDAENINLRIKKLKIITNWAATEIQTNKQRWLNKGVDRYWFNVVYQWTALHPQGLGWERLSEVRISFRALTNLSSEYDARIWKIFQEKELTAHLVTLWSAMDKPYLPIKGEITNWLYNIWWWNDKGIIKELYKDFFTVLVGNISYISKNIHHWDIDGDEDWIEFIKAIIDIFDVFLMSGSKAKFRTNWIKLDFDNMGIMNYIKHIIVKSGNQGLVERLKEFIVWYWDDNTDLVYVSI